MNGLPEILQIWGICKGLRTYDAILADLYGYNEANISRFPWNIFIWRRILPRYTATRFTQCALRIEKPLSIVTCESRHYRSLPCWVCTWYWQVWNSDSNLESFPVYIRTSWAQMKFSSRLQRSANSMRAITRAAGSLFLMGSSCRRSWPITTLGPSCVHTTWISRLRAFTTFERRWSQKLTRNKRSQHAPKTETPAGFDEREVLKDLVVMDLTKRADLIPRKSSCGLICLYVIRFYH